MSGRRAESGTGDRDSPVRGASGRVVAFDLGERRVGVAVCDSAGTVATPYGVIERSGDPSSDLAALAATVADLGAARVVVGLPLSLDGTIGPAARAALAEADALRSHVDVPVEPHDERLTTLSAERVLRGSRARRGPRGVVDQVAATVLLQAWLDSRGAVGRR